MFILLSLTLHKTCIFPILQQSNQEAATYYYSPLNVYTFGIVNCSTAPTQLLAFIYYEGQAKKGGNAVTSMLWKMLQYKGLLNGGTEHEINLVFDNCAGQNKNRMVTLSSSWPSSKSVKQQELSFLLKATPRMTVIACST